MIVQLNPISTVLISADVFVMYDSASPGLNAGLFNTTLGPCIITLFGSEITEVVPKSTP